MFQRSVGRQLWSTPITVASRSRYGRSTRVSIKPRSWVLKSRTSRSAPNVRPASPASSATNTPYLVSPKLPLSLTAAVMSPEPSPSSAGPPTPRVSSHPPHPAPLQQSHSPSFPDTHPPPPPQP